MRQVVTAVAIVVRLVTATVATGGSQDESAVVTAAALAPLVLSAKDLGKGWSVNTGAPPSTASPTAGPCNGPNAAARAEATVRRRRRRRT